MGPSELATPFFATQGTLTGGLLNRAASKHAEFIGFDEKSYHLETQLWHDSITATFGPVPGRTLRARARK
jgi:hypothetical protein